MCDISVSLVIRPADSSAQLIQLSQTRKSIAAVDNERVRIFYVQSRLDNSRRDEDIEFLREKAFHNMLELMTAHFTMGRYDACFGNSLCSDAAVSSMS